jgi:hypothetical protein
MRILQRQQEQQRDQCAYALDLLQQRHLRITLLGQHLDPLLAGIEVLSEQIREYNERVLATGHGPQL